MSDNNTNKPSFFTGVKQEFAKITWPDQTQVTKQAVVVVVVSMITGALIAVIDLAVQYGVNLLSM